ncbi:MAG TPA: serpin family protein, partial [Firmicutes bacterium]|nr:serpin family protein [Bacillota bacterium]
RFKYEYESSLNDVLKSLGMEIAFNSQAADFSAMRTLPPRLYIAEVKHKAFVEVNEKGTEAAAATSVEIRLESAPLNQFSMTVDRPFFFSIVDQKTGSILFMGSVADPQS